MAVIGTRNGKPNLYIIWRVRSAKGKRTKRYKSTGTTDRKIAEKKLAEFEAKRTLGVDWIEAPKSDRAVTSVTADPFVGHQTLKITDLVEAWAATRVGEKSPQQVTETKEKVLRIANGAGMKTLADFTEQGVREFVNGLTKRVPGNKRGKVTEPAHLSTKNKYRIAAKTFDTWLTKKKYQPAKVLQDLGVLKYEGDIKPLKSRVRAEWTMEQVERLFTTARESDRTIEGYSGMLRFWLYLCAATSGYRRRELSSLTPASFHLDGDSPGVDVVGEWTKNGDQAVQPVPDYVVPLFQMWLADKKLGQPLFPRLDKLKTGKMLRLDIEATEGLTYKVGRNGYRDFHSLRALYVTNLTTSGAAPSCYSTGCSPQD